MSAVPAMPVSASSAFRVESIDIRNKRSRAKFIKAQWAFYRNDPAWVPPLLMERHAFLDPATNPFFENAEAAYWLLYRGDELVGRVAA
ncbi:MAG TPA: N-acetyltransferase, partial [bacterium]|nr:N-acetyltransferase [bacterium]